MVTATTRFAILSPHMRTRFPPSPTGFLHIGALRTALYNELLARQTNGTFALRIEDTDQARSVPGAVEQFLRAMHWAGIDPDEGVVLKDGEIAQTGTRGPYFQSERLPIYKKYADELVAKGHAYPCFCTPERLDEMRKKQEQLKQAPMYDRHCLRLPKDEVQKRIAAGEKHVYRLKIPHERTITFVDDIRGKVSFQGHTIDDQVLLKSDGFPTYHLAHVVDDHLMEMDLILRGEEWLSSLPKHLLLFEFLGWPVPRYAHLPLLLNKDRSKLSKRQNAVSVDDYIEKGYLPEALINFLALLGWNPGTEQELFSHKELIEAFSLDRVQKAGAVFDPEKLDWLQGQWMRKIEPKEFAERIRPLVTEKFPAAASDKDFAKKSALVQERITFFKDAPEMLGFFYVDPKPTIDVLVNEKQKVTKELLADAMKTVRSILESISESDWSAERILVDVKAEVGKGTWKLGQLLWPLRAALTGLPFSPGAVEVAAVLGKKKTLERLERAMKMTT